MDFLTSCPDDNLRSILSYLDGDDLFYLWMTGCSDLQKKMQKNVTSFFFDHSSFFSSFRPSILKFFPNVNNVHIRLSNYRTPSDSNHDFLDLIPVGINSLVLDFEFSMQTLVKFLRSSHSTNSNSSSPHPIWPQLQTLTLGSNSSFVIDVNFLSLLPSTLTHLDVHSNLFNHYELIGMFPRGLKKLALGQCANGIPESAVLDFPPHLTSLSINGEWPSNYTSQLPRCLLELDHSHFGFDLGNCDLNIRDLPRSLTHLSIPGYQYTTEQIQQLPRDLISLSIGTDNQTGLLFDNTVLLHLPKSLKSISCLSDFNLDSIPLLPKGLTTLSIREPSVGNLENIQKLPKNLTSLKLESDFEMTPEVMSWLPRTITDLTIESLSDDLCAFLPPFLIEITFKKGVLTQDGVRLLPTTLKRLTAPYASFRDDAAISGLPYNLQHLTLSDAFSPESKRDCLLTDSFSGLLPKSLRTLVIWDRKFHAFNDKFIQGLQSHQDLRTLSLSGLSNYITEEVFSNLPANLLHFKIDWQSPDLTNAAISNLPKKLSSFSIVAKSERPNPLHELHIALCDKDYALFPRTLRRLVLPETYDFTALCAKYLPRNIHYLKTMKAPKRR